MYRHEILFTSIRDYLCGAFDTQMFISDQDGELINTRAPKSSVKLKEFYQYSLTAIRLLDIGYMDQGFSWFSKAHDLVHHLLAEQDPRLLETLLDVSMLLHTKGHQKVYEALCKYICDLVAMKTNSEHPWARIFSQVNKLPGPHFLSTMELSWRCGFDMFTKSFGALHADNIICFSNFVVRVYDKDEAEQRLSHFLARAEQATWEAKNGLEMSYAYAHGLYRQGKHREAIKILDDVILSCERVGKSALEISAREISAQCWERVLRLSATGEERIPAETVLANAIRRSQNVYGPESARTLGLENLAWDIFHRQGLRPEPLSKLTASKR